MNKTLEYQKFRQFFTRNSFLVICGKSAQQNEELLTEHLDKKDLIIHTKEPGSPFCVIKSRKKKISSQDIKEAAQFCACFSQQWKKQAKAKKARKTKQVEVHIFKQEQIIKEKKQKTGTFSVLGKIQKGKVQLELWLGMQKGILKAASKTALTKPLLKILPGKINKENMAKLTKKQLEKKFNLKISIQEIESAIPAGGFA